MRASDIFRRRELETEGTGLRVCSCRIECSEGLKIFCGLGNIVT